jgi:hypothetical protein
MKKNLKTFLSVLCLAILLVNIMPIYAGATEATATPAPTAAADAAATEAPAEYVAPESWTAFMMYSAEKGDWALYEPTEGVNTVTFLGDGVYEITLKGADIAATAKAETPQVFLIDIPEFCAALDAQGKSYQNYTDTTNAHDQAKHAQPTDLTIDVNVFVDGQEVRCKSELLNYGNIEEKGTFRIEIYNIWGLHAAAIVENSPVIAEAICPESEIKVQFTIQGTGYNTEAGAEAIAAANPTPTTAPVAAEDTSSTETTGTDTGTDTATDAAADTSAESDSSSNTGLIIGIVAAVVVVAGIVVVLLTRKKK